MVSGGFSCRADYWFSEQDLPIAASLPFVALDMVSLRLTPDGAITETMML